MQSKDRIFMKSFDFSQEGPLLTEEVLALSKEIDFRLAHPRGISILGEVRNVEI